MLKVNGEVLELNHFPDGSLRLAVPNFPDSRHSGGANCIEWNYEHEEELIALIYAVGQMRECDPGCAIQLNMPYIPNARMDRVNQTSLPREVFTLKYFANVINSLKFEAVFVLDPHSNVSVALIDRVVCENPVYQILTAMDSVCPDIIYFPDEGSCKRYAKMFDKPYAFGIKQRDWATGAITGLDVVTNGHDIVGKNVLIVDDICSRGGTFLYSARKLKALGAADISIYVTHCESTVLSGELLDGDLIKKMYTTNSIFTKSHPKIEVIPL